MLIESLKIRKRICLNGYAELIKAYRCWESKPFPAGGKHDFLLDAEGVADISVPLLKSLDIDWDLDHGTNVIVSFGRILVNIITMPGVVLDRICNDLGCGIIPCWNRASGPIRDYSEDVKTR